MIKKPIWCKCRKHSWTRRSLLWSWENNKPVSCPEPQCKREITVDAIEELLQQIGVLNLEDELDIESAD